MAFLHQYLFPALWMSWGIYWWALSRDVKVSARQEPVGSRLLHLIPLVLALGLLWLPTLPVPVLGERFFPRGTQWVFWGGVAITVTGLLFTVWARAHLGRNWSVIVAVKQDHELVTTGPYRLVRHPIYTGILLAFIGSAFARAEWRGVLAVVLVTWALWRKLNNEERWMREQFGDAYQAYSRRVAALVPFVL